MSKTYFISRHPGAHAWADRQGFVAEVVQHFDPAVVQPGDVVLGTLAGPFQQAIRNIQQARRDPSLLGRVAHSSRITGDVLWT